MHFDGAAREHLQLGERWLFRKAQPPGRIRCWHRRDAELAQLGLNLLKGQYNTEWTDIMAIALLSLTPMLVIFVFFQRQLIQGIAGTGLK